MKIGLTEARIQVSKSYVNFSIDLANFDFHVVRIYIANYYIQAMQNAYLFIRRSSLILFIGYFIYMHFFIFFFFFL